MSTDTSPEAPKPTRKPRKAAAASADPQGTSVTSSTEIVAVDAPADDNGAASSASSGFVSQAQDTVRKVANAGKDRATDALTELSDMIEEVAKTIDDRVGGNYGGYARKASGSISGIADNLKAKDVDELLDDAREFVRTQPAVAIGAAAAVGFVLTRLIKSGEDDRA